MSSTITFLVSSSLLEAWMFREWQSTTLTLNNEGDVIQSTLPHNTMIRVQFAGQPSYFFIGKKIGEKIGEKGLLYWIMSDTSTFRIQKATMSNGQLTWCVYAEQRFLLLYGKDMLNNLRALQKDADLFETCVRSIHTLTVRTPDASQRLQLLGPQTPEISAAEESRSFHKKILERYRQKVHNDWTTWLHHYAASSAEPIVLKDLIKERLAQHWAWTKGTVVSYTALPTHPVTTALVAIAQKLAEIDAQPAITYIMPGVHTMPETNPEYPDLTSLDLSLVLRTHILHSTGLYLLPVALCLTSNPQHYAFGVYNPYYELDENPEYMTIPATAWARLWGHSPVTITVQHAQQTYDSLRKDTKTLLGQLLLLCDQLRWNGAHEGIGDSNHAGRGAYPALLAFSNYYAAVNKDYIPVTIKALVDTMLEKLGTTGQAIELCVANHQEWLRAAIKKEEVSLNAITLDATASTTLLEEARHDLERCRATLHQALLDPDYAGRDPVDVTPALLERLEISLEMHREEDLLLIRSLSPEEIAIFLRAPRLQQQILQQWQTLDAFVGFIHTTPTPQVHALLTALSQSVENFNQLPVKSRALPFLSSLRPEQIAGVLDALQQYLPEIIGSSLDFFRLLNALTSEQRTVMLAVIQNNLHSIIQNIDYLRTFLFWLTAEQCTMVCTAMPADFYTSINSLQDFSIFVQDLDQEQWAAVCHAILRHLNKIIKGLYDFASFLLALTVAQCTVVCAAMQAQLYAIIPTSDHFRSLLLRLTTEQCRVICAAMQTDLHKIIKTPDDVHEILRYLAPEKQAVVYDAIQTPLVAIIKNAQDFHQVLCHFTQNQHTAVYNAMQPNVAAIIHNARDFCIVLSYLTPEQCAAVCLAIQPNFSRIIKNADQLRDILLELSVEKCTAVCRVMSTELHKIIKTADDFYTVVSILSSRERAAVIAAIALDFYKKINSTSDLYKVLYYLTPEQWQDIFSSIPTHFANIKNAPETPVLHAWTQCKHYLDVLRAKERHGHADALPLLIKKIQVMTEAEHFLFEKLRHLKCERRALTAGQWQEDLAKILKKTDEQQDIILLQRAHDSGFYCFFNRKVSNSGAQLFREIFGAVPSILVKQHRLT